MRKIVALIALFGVCHVAFAAFDSAHQQNSGNLSIVRMTPEGEDVQTNREIVFTFDRDVVPIGRMERSAAEIPISITPELKCQWRWFSRNTLGCRLNEADQLKEATEYTVLIKPGIVTEDGIGLAQEETRKIITARPKVEYAKFKTWKATDVPVIRLTFNQPVSKASILHSISFTPNADFNVDIDDSINETPAYLSLPGEKNSFIKLIQEKIKGDDQASHEGEEEFRRNWLIQPKQGLGLDQDIQLLVKPGLHSVTGPMTGIEDKNVVNFVTFPEFKFIGFRCYPSPESFALAEQLSNKQNAANTKPKKQNSNEQNEAYDEESETSTGQYRAGSSFIIRTDAPLDQQPKCDPLKGAGLQFSTPVIVDEIKKGLTLWPNLAGDRHDYDPWENAPRDSYLTQSHRHHRTYTVWFPEFLKAFQKYQLFVNKGEVHDEFNNALPDPIKMEVMTDHRQPQYYMPHTNAVLEKAVDSEQPVYVTNLNAIKFHYGKLTSAGVTNNLSKQIPVAKAQDVSFQMPLQMRDLLGEESGVLVGNFETEPVVSHGGYCDTCFITQITPWQVHAKIGHFNSVAWVVDFATGKPVEGAKVELFLTSESRLLDHANVHSTATTDQEGLATLPGNKEIDPHLDVNRDRQFWMIRVTKGKDIAILPLNYNYKLNGEYGGGYSWWGEDTSYSQYPQKRAIYQHIHTWGATAQGIYRLGDTIQYKIYVRDQDNKQFVPAPTDTYSLNIIDPKDNIVTTRENIKLNEFGAFDGEFKIEKEAAIGWYRFELVPSYASNLIWKPLKVLVADFTPASFHVSSELNADKYASGQELTLNSHARLHAGGPYVDAKTRFNVTLRPAPLEIKDPNLKSFYFDSYSGNRESITLSEKQGLLDKKGDQVNQVTIPDTQILVGKLSVETAVRDDRGKFVSTLASARYIGRDRFVGLKLSSWYLTAHEAAKIIWAVIDENGKFAANSPVEIKVEHEVIKAARVKGAGNAYLTEYQHSWEEVAQCKEKSGAEAKECEFTPKEPGEYRVTASVMDTKNLQHTSALNTWATGQGYVLWDEPSNETLQVIAQQDSYKVGETAKFLVKNPYPNGTALITVERYGVMRHFVQHWDSSTPVVDIPITADDVPGFYLSIMVMSPRVEKPLAEGEVDLGKPAYKIAYRQIDVVDPVKQLQVAVSSDKDTYKPREKATINLTVATNDNQVPSEKQEIAVAVLDESVFDLLQGGNTNFDAYKGFYRLDGRDLENFNLLTRLIGRQKFAKKGAVPAGDGGKSVDMRTIFKYVSYWNPSLRTDAQGKAQFQLDLPDNLTGWRVLAMAVTPNDKMGLGIHSFKVNKPIEIRPVMPNQVTEGDDFLAGFTVMNRTDGERTFNVKVNATGALDVSQSPQEKIYSMVAKPFERVNVWLPVKAKGDGKIAFVVNASDGSNSDGLEYSVPVNKYRSLLTAANYGTTTENQIIDPVQVPKDIYGDVGRFSMVLSPSVIANLDGAFEYVRDYQYWCWEQRITKAVMAAQFKSLNAYLSPSVKWAEADTLPQQMLDSASSYQAPNGGMTFWIPDDNYVSPYLSAYTELAFNWLRRANYSIPQEVESKLKAYLHQMLSENVFPTFYNPGMSSSVRAVALAALAEQGEVSLSDLERYRAAVPDMDLFGKAHYLQAAARVPGAEKIIEETTKMILGQAAQSGGKFQFNERWDDSYRQILATPLRSNCAVLESFTYLGEQSQWAPLVGDIPFKLVRAITQSRGARTYFQNTQENVFCLNSLVSYARIYEATQPNMTIRVSLDKDVIGTSQFSKLSAKPETHFKNITPEDVGQRRELKLEKSGEGRIYYSSRIQYAPLAINMESVNSGIEVTREYSVERDKKWQLLKSPMQLTRGELVRVDIYLSLPTARNFVVVNDPVPGGLEPVNRDLATTSTVDADKGDFKAAENSWWFKYSDWSYYGANEWSFYHKELRHDSVRFYSDYLPAGNYHLSYTAQSIAEGDFRLQPTNAEEMYDPDVFGKSTPAELEVATDKEK